MRAALVMLALCQLASSETCAGHHEKVCMDACGDHEYPEEGDNVDKDCCAERKKAYCADGYRLVEDDHVCYKEGEVTAHTTCCVLCEGEEDCHNGPGDEWLENNECPDYTLFWFLFFLFVFIFILMCSCSWTFCVIAFCNHSKLGTDEPLCCANCCSPPVWFKINVGLAVCNLAMFILFCVWDEPFSIVCYLVMMIGTAVAAWMLKSKQAALDRADFAQPGLVVTGRPVASGVQMGHVVVGQPPVAGEVQMGQPVVGQPVVGQPAMGQPVVGKVVGQVA